MQSAANWVGNQAPPPLSSNVFVFQGDILVPYQWPYVDTNYGTSILIFSNNTALNSIKILAGSNHTVNLGSYVRQDTPALATSALRAETPSRAVTALPVYTMTPTSPMLSATPVAAARRNSWTGGRLDVYGVLRDGAGTSSRLVKSGNAGLNLTGDLAWATTPTPTPAARSSMRATIKMAKLPGFNAIPGDVTVNGTGSLHR